MQGRVDGNKSVDEAHAEWIGNGSVMPIWGRLTESQKKAVEGMTDPVDIHATLIRMAIDDDMVAMYVKAAEDAR